MTRFLPVLMLALAGCCPSSVPPNGRTWRVHGTSTREATCFRVPGGSARLEACGADFNCRQRVYLLFDPVEFRDDVPVSVIVHMDNGESKLVMDGEPLYCPTSVVRK